MKAHRLKRPSFKDKGRKRAAARHVPLLQGARESWVGGVHEVENTNFSFTFGLKAIVNNG